MRGCEERRCTPRLDSIYTRTFDTMMRRGARVMARAVLTTTTPTTTTTTTRAIGTSVACEAKAAVAKGKGGKAGKGNASI